MSIYTPDAWNIVSFTSNGEKVDKVFAGWYGGYTGSDSWKMSSGIVKIEETDNAYLVHNYSGSIYTCYKNAERLTGLMASIYASWEKRLLESTMQATMAPVEMSLILEKYIELRN